MRRRQNPIKSRDHMYIESANKETLRLGVTVCGYYQRGRPYIKSSQASRYFCQCFEL
jgi:hypothetical protein